MKVYLLELIRIYATLILRNILISTGNEQPVKAPSSRAPVHLRQEVDKNIDDMLEKGVIEPCNSPWASCVALVKKKD